MTKMQLIKDSPFMSQQEVVGIIAVNSIDFVNQIFTCFAENKIAVFLRDEADTYKIEVTGASNIITPKAQTGWCKPQFTPKSSDTRAIAQIAFTSGTTGLPKGVLLSHRALNDVVTRLNAIMEVDSSIREYIGVPVNYSFGFGRCRAVATAGGHFYLPENRFNPLEIRDLLLAGSINAISAVPSLWRTLFQCIDIFGDETHAIKWIEIGSQYMSRQEKETLRQLFPNAIIVQHYGLTEASRSTFLRIDQTHGEHLESVGKVYGQTEIKLSADHKIMIRGPHVAEDLLIEGQLKKNIDAEGWLETSDLGEIKDGYIYYLGRADDLINCGGIKLSPDDIEKLIREELNLKAGIAIARVDDPMRGNAILVGLLKSADLDPKVIKTAAIKAVAKRNIQSPDAIKVMEFDEFPTTATGKVQRRQLGQLYTERMERIASANANWAPNIASINPPTEAELPTDLTPGQREIIAAWKGVLGVDHINVNDNFFEIGGDSLTAISVMVKMEKLGISPQIAKGMLQGLSVRELAERMEGYADKSQQSHKISNSYTKASLNINILRGFLVLCVIFAHWSDAFLNLLPAFISGIKPFLAPILATGTPGFAIIYGVSAGYSMFTIFKSDRHRLNQILRTTALLLGAGILALSSVEVARRFVTQEIHSLTDITNSFYSVLTYYLLISLTLPMWFWLVSKFKNPIAGAVLLSVLLYCIHYYIFSPLTAYPAQGFVELAKLMISAKYSYFNLAAGTLGGVAVGISIRQEVDAGKDIPDSFTWLGLALIAAGVVICSHSGREYRWAMWPLETTYLWRWLVYAGCILIGLRWMNNVLSKYNTFSTPRKFVFQAIASVGILAFPFFVTHAMIIPLKYVIGATGLSGGLSLILAMVLFLVSAVFLFRKVYTANFAW